MIELRKTNPPLYSYTSQTLAWARVSRRTQSSQALFVMRASPHKNTIFIVREVSR